MHGERLRCFVVSVKRGLRGPQIGLSRTHPNLVRKLFALEVPEIADGTRRDRGPRPRGRPPHQDRGALHRARASTPRAPASARWAQRVRAVMTELHGEKIDIVDWSEDPADVRRRRAVARPGARRSRSSTRRLRAARVIVPDYQLSLAIGKEGQNARLAAKLTGWRIDIRSDTAGRRAGGRHRPRGGADGAAAARRPGERRARAAAPAAGAPLAAADRSRR